MSKITVFIVDDERIARDELKHLLINYKQFEVVGEAENADKAKILIEQLKPELLFLDIQMPEKSGFDLLEMLDFVPVVIFVTAFDSYAIKAFEVGAMNYLMKPIREERFEKAILQIENRLGKDEENEFFIRNRNEGYFVKWSSVYLIESLDNYARVYFDNKNGFLKTSLNLLLERLDQCMFFRVNRSQVINLNFIESIAHQPNGKVKLKLTNGLDVELSNRQSLKFKQMKLNKK